MELEQLKNSWKEVTEKIPASRYSIRNILHKPGKSPLAALKRNFRKQIILLSFLAIMIMYQFRERDFLNSIFFWCYIGFTISLSIFFYINYHIAGKLEKMDRPLSSHLSIQVKILEKRMKWHRVFTRIAVIVFFILAEILPYYTNERMLNKWHALNPLLRITIYLAFIIFQYYAGKFLARKRYGRHLDRLKNLLTETEEKNA